MSTEKTMIVWAFRFHLFLTQVRFYICYDFLNLLCSNGYVRQKQWILFWKFDWKSKVLRQNSQTRGLFLRIIWRIVGNRDVVLRKKRFLSSKLRYCHWYFFIKSQKKVGDKSINLMQKWKHCRKNFKGAPTFFISENYNWKSFRRW